MPSNVRNSFLQDLLTLQQDGAHAISAPTNWTTRQPLLEVATDIDEVIDDLSDAILVGSETNETGRWHFFVGSPGNGKSAAMGKLCRKLISDKNCQVRDENDEPIEDLGDDTIPYALNVFEGGKDFRSAQIVQDASVVRNPFAPDVDPATELVDTLRRAWEKGISLVVCTNRGVLEKAHQDTHLDGAVNQTPWYKILSAVVSAQASPSGQVEGVRELDARRRVFQNIAVKYKYLDNRSLLLGSETFLRLLQRATDGDHWEECEACAAKDMCPFRLNRAWLSDPEAGDKFLRLMTRAEVLSGQVIVFREALAIISLILAGCAKDYGETHPCDWVRAKIANNDIFALASRRIYMSLFASQSPRGLEASVDLRKRQFKAFRGLSDALDETFARARAALGHVLKSQGPSTDVGITRLLGENGVVAVLDPCKAVLPAGFYDRWDSDFEAIPASCESTCCFTDIERVCLSIWRELEESLESAADHSVSETHWAVRRWSSNYLLHFGALMEGNSAWAEELDTFATLIRLMMKPKGQRTIDDSVAVKELESQLEKLVNSVSGDRSSAVLLSEATTLSGRWVQEKLKPKAAASDSSGSASLVVYFEGGERAVLGAQMYLWLNQLAAGKLESRCFPQELFAGVSDARVRAAAKGRYALENNDVELTIETGAGGSFKIMRIEGRVHVS